MCIQLQEIAGELNKLEALVGQRIAVQPKNPIYNYIKDQVEYIRNVIKQENTFTLENEKKIHMGVMAVKENLDKVDLELDDQVHKVTYLLGKYTGRIK